MIPITKKRTNSSNKLYVTTTENSPQVLNRISRKSAPRVSGNQDNLEDFFSSKQNFNTIFMKIWKLNLDEKTKKQHSAEQMPTLLIPKQKFLNLIKSVYLAFFQSRPDQIEAFTSESTVYPNVYVGRDQRYSLNDFQEYVYKEILGREVLSQSPEDIEVLLRNIY